MTLLPASPYGILNTSEYCGNTALNNQWGPMYKKRKTFIFGTTLAAVLVMTIAVYFYSDTPGRSERQSE